MSWVLSLLLLSVIVSWLHTSRYHEQMEELREEFRNKELEYQREINRLGCMYLEDTDLLKEKLRRRDG